MIQPGETTGVSHEYAHRSTVDYTTTPLIDFERKYPLEQTAAIHQIITDRRQSLEDVYEDAADCVDELIHASSFNALHIRTDRATRVRCRFMMNSYPELFSNEYEAHMFLDQMHREYKDLAELFKDRNDNVKLGLPYGMPAYYETIEALGPIHSPETALRTLKTYPALPSVELASQTHPLHWDATNAMSAHLHDAMKQELPGLVTENEDIELAERKSRIKIARTAGKIGQSGGMRFAIIPKKRLYACDPETGIAVYKRASYIIDRDSRPDTHYVEEQRHLSAIIQRALVMQTRVLEPNKSKPGSPSHTEYDEILAEGADIIDALLTQPQNERPPWLQPINTSLFAVQGERQAT